MNLDWQTISTSMALGAVLVALVNGGFARPKTRGEGKAAEGTAFDMLTKAQIERQLSALRSAEEENTRAKEAVNECTKELMRCKIREREAARAFDAIISALTEIVPLLPADQQATVAVRAAIRTARQARYEP